MVRLRSVNGNWPAQICSSIWHSQWVFEWHEISRKEMLNLNNLNKFRTNLPIFSFFFSPSLQIMLQLDGYNPKHSSLVCYQLNERRTSHSFSFVVVFVFPWQYFSILEPEFVVFGGPELHLHYLEQVCCKDNPPLRKLYLRGWSCYSHKQGPNDN